MFTSYNICFGKHNVRCLTEPQHPLRVPGMALGNRIKAARERLGWGQTDLLVRVNRLLPKGEKELTQQALSGLENRDSNKSEFAVQIADALGVSVRWLLAGQGEPEDVDWPFPDQELLARVLKLSRDWRSEVQGVLRERVAVAEASQIDVGVSAARDRQFRAPAVPVARGTQVLGDNRGLAWNLTNKEKVIDETTTRPGKERVIDELAPRAPSKKRRLG